MGDNNLQDTTRIADKKREVEIGRTNNTEIMNISHNNAATTLYYV